MSAPYYSIITNNGLVKHAEASANAVTINLTELAVGDSNGVDYDPLPENTALQNELHRVSLTHVVVDENNPNQLIIEGVIDETVGPFYVREIGIFDADGDLFALGKYPETFKSNLPSGVGKKLFIRMILGFSNAPNVTLIASDVNNDPNFSSHVNDELNDRLKISENLGDLDNTETARNNLGVYSETEVDGRTSNKNYIINGNFDIWQRGVSTTNNGVYLADRFIGYNGDGARTYSRQEFAFGQIDVPNNPKYYLRHDQTAIATVSAPSIHQRIESVRTLSGSTVTISFYARVASGTVSVLPRFTQHFGSGGSPSPDQTADGQTVDVTTSWQKFTATVVIPDISGKTLGTNNNDHLGVIFGLPLNATFTIDIAQVKLDKGSIATEFIPKYITEELALCQRYYCSSQSISPTNLDEFYMLPRASSGQINRQTIAFPVLMRSSPTMSITRTNGTANLGAFAEVNERGFRKSIGGGQYEIAEYIWTADAEL